VKFVLMFGCNVWVYEFEDNQVVNVEFYMLMMYIHVYLCSTQIWWRMNCCWWIVDEFMFDWCCFVMRYCCWWFIPWVFINTDLWYELSCCWGFCKTGLNWWIVLKWYLISCLMSFWKPFWAHEPVNNLWKRIWVWGDQNWEFWVKKGWNRKVFLQNWWLFA